MQISYTLQVEYTPQAYVATDLDMFFANFSPTQVGERPVLNSIDGGTNSRAAFQCVIC